MQISAIVSDETQRLLDATVQKRGLKKGFVIETALRHYLLALNAIPGEFITPPVLTLTPESWQAMTAALADTAEPTPALRELLGNA